MSYQKSQENRQAILDHLHANPLKSAQQISNESGIGRNSVENCVRLMTARGELEKVGAGAATRYRAIATTTVSANEIIREMQEKRAMAGIKAEKLQVNQGKVERLGYYRQQGGSWQANSAAGGQGAVRREIGVQSSAGML